MPRIKPILLFKDKSDKIEIEKSGGLLLRNYFSDLELELDADLESVRRAYRRLARRFHPDLNTGDLYAEQSFLRISEAYEQLDSEEKIQQLRQSLSGTRVNENSGRWRVDLVVPESSPELVDDWALKKNQRLIEDLDVHVIAQISDEQKNSGKQRLVVSIEAGCESCLGSGGHSQSVRETCKTCAGLAYQLIRRGAFRWKKSCEPCRGKGYVLSDACVKCSGYGKLQKKLTYELLLPEDFSSDAAMQYKGLGNQSYDRKSQGDLWVNWKIKS